MKIEKLTPEQKAYLPVFRQQYLDIACDGKRIEREKMQNAINAAYAHIGKKPPMLIILQSPLQAMMAIKFMKVFAKEETGHHHTLLEKNAQLLIDQTNEFIAYLKVGAGGAVLEHERSFDTHESIKFEPGIYEVRRQREYTPQGYRRAAD